MTEPTATAPARETGTCGCGTVTAGFHSGQWECGQCWDWRKLHSAESKFWLEGISHLFANEYGTGPDMNDLMLWARWGVRDEVEAALVTLQKLAGRYLNMTKHAYQWGPAASDEVKALMANGWANPDGKITSADWQEIYDLVQKRNKERIEAEDE